LTRRDGDNVNKQTAIAEQTHGTIAIVNDEGFLEDLMLLQFTMCERCVFANRKKEANEENNNNRICVL
jgi:hypothetical protein